MTNGNITGWLFDSISKDPAIVKTVRSVLYYNAGVGWIDVYRNEAKQHQTKTSNQPYLSKVAEKLRDYVPKYFGIRDPILVAPMLSAQQTVDVCVTTNKCGQ